MKYQATLPTGETVIFKSRLKVVAIVAAAGWENDWEMVSKHKTINAADMQARIIVRHSENLANRVGLPRRPTKEARVIRVFAA